MEIVGLGCLVIADCHLDFIIACIIDPDEEISVCGVQGKCFVETLISCKTGDRKSFCCCPRNRVRRPFVVIRYSLNCGVSLTWGGVIYSCVYSEQRQWWFREHPGPEGR